MSLLRFCAIVAGVLGLVALFFPVIIDIDKRLDEIFLSITEKLKEVIL